MKLTRNQSLLLAALGVLAALLLGVGALCDLSIDQALYAPENPAAILFEAFCYWPLYLPFVLLGMVWTFLYRDHPTRRTLGELLVVATLFILLNQSLPNLVQRGLFALESAGMAFAALVLTFVLTLAAISLASRWDRSTLLRAELAAKLGVLLCVTDNVVINLLKLLWNRARFDEMAAAGDFSAFSPWYLPLGNGGTSFPSGHTAAACGVLALLILPALFERWKGRELFLTIGCYVYIGISAFFRVVMGRHFLSDTVAAAVLMSVLFLLLTHNRRFADAVRRTQAAAEAAQAATEAEEKTGRKESL